MVTVYVGAGGCSGGSEQPACCREQPLATTVPEVWMGLCFEFSLNRCELPAYVYFVFAFKRLFSPSLPPFGVCTSLFIGGISRTRQSWCFGAE